MLKMITNNCVEITNDCFTVIDDNIYRKIRTGLVEHTPPRRTEETRRKQSIYKIKTTTWKQ